MWWSWVLMLVGATGLLLIGNKLKAGWYVNILAQVLWIVYAIQGEQWGFIVSAIIYGFVYTNGLMKFDGVRSKKGPMRLEYDKEAGMGYIYLTNRDDRRGVVTRSLDYGVLGDYDNKTHELVGLEVFLERESDEPRS